MTEQIKVVAILEDDPLVLRAVERMVLFHGYCARPFFSAEEFLQAVATLQVDCLVTDIHLGDYCGIDLVHLMLSALDVEIPVIFMTGSNDELLRKQAAEVGCVAYLQKPFQAELLIAAIERATGRKIDPA